MNRRLKQNVYVCLTSVDFECRPKTLERAMIKFRELILQPF